jgi:hypothetical protein
LKHTPEAIEAWASQLAERFGGRPIAVGLEQSRGSLICALTKYAHLVLYPIHPTTLARFRAALFPSGAKDDPVDADLLLELLLHHRAHLRRLEPDTVETRRLQFLVEQRRQWVNEKTRQMNRLTAQLKMYYPQMLQWFEEVDSPLVGALLLRWPTLEQLQRARPATLRDFFHQHHCHRAACTANRPGHSGHSRCGGGGDLSAGCTTTGSIDRDVAERHCGTGSDHCERGYRASGLCSV